MRSSFAKAWLTTFPGVGLVGGGDGMVELWCGDMKAYESSWKGGRGMVGGVTRERGEVTFFTLVVFEEFHALEGSGTADEFMAEFGLVVEVVVVDLLVAVSCIV
jgi:hypothetical protein